MHFSYNPPHEWKIDLYYTKNKNGLVQIKKIALGYVVINFELFLVKIY